MDDWIIFGLKVESDLIYDYVDLNSFLIVCRWNKLKLLFKINSKSPWIILNLMKSWDNISHFIIWSKTTILSQLSKITSSQTVLPLHYCMI